MPNAESAIQKEMEQQDTGNHKAPGAPDEKRARTVSAAPAPAPRTSRRPHR